LNRRLIAAALAAGLMLPAAGAAQGSVEECIANNGPRYTAPGDATTHQYVDTGGLCADAQDDDTDVVITPIGGGNTPDRDGSRTGDGAQPGGSGATPPPASSPAAPVPAEAPAAPAPSQTPAPTPKPRDTPGGGGTPAPATVGARGDGATTTVRQALSASAASQGLSTPAVGLAAVPGGLLGAALIALGLAGAGIGARRLGRR